MAAMHRRGLTSAIAGLLLLGCAACSTWSGASHYAAGTRALDRGDAPAAIADLEQAARLLPGSSEVQNHLGIAYEAAGRPDAALVAWRRAVALDCGNEAAAKNLQAAQASVQPVSQALPGGAAP